MLKSATTTEEIFMNASDVMLMARKPTHPGEILREEFFPDFGLSIAQAADKLHVSRQTVNELLCERRSVSPDMSVRLARLFGTTPQYWMNLQRNIDLWNALDLHKEEFEEIKPLAAAM